MAELKNEIGNVYGYLTVIGRAGSKDNYATWWCKCKCGNIVEVKGLNLRRSGTQSCGCLQKEKAIQTNHNKFIDLTGEKFGRLTVLRFGGIKNNRTMWVCQCECGAIVEVDSGNLRKDGGTLSCGCLNSKGEFKIAEILKANNIQFEKQFKFDDCLSDAGHQLRFDFAIIKNEKMQYLIEYHGEQHYSRVEFMDRNNDDFEARLRRDKIKMDYCRMHNIPLIIIPYTHFHNISLNDLLLNYTKFLDKGEVNK